MWSVRIVMLWKVTIRDRKYVVVQKLGDGLPSVEHREHIYRSFGTMSSCVVHTHGCGFVSTVHVAVRVITEVRLHSRLEW